MQSWTQTLQLILIFAITTSGVAMSQTENATKKPIIIAHRGASGYLPEHTLAAKALAYGMGADFIEQDIVVTRDSQLIVLHDIHLDTVTNVASVFPQRKRTDNRYYAIDFDLDEIKQLRVNERIDLKTGAAVFSNRFPVGASTFHIPTLAEEIELIQGLNRSTGKSVGIYPEIKKPIWHRNQGKDISALLIAELKRFGYTDKSDEAYLQCFDAMELRRVRNELDCKLRLIQLIGHNSWKESGTDYNQMVRKEGLNLVKEYADGIGPSVDWVINSDQGDPKPTKLTQLAHELGLLVHPFTLRADALPKFAKSQSELVKFLVQECEVDGYFTDFPDRN